MSLKYYYLHFYPSILQNKRDKYSVIKSKEKIFYFLEPDLNQDYFQEIFEDLNFSALFPNKF
jgi:hypothetical protein